VTLPALGETVACMLDGRVRRGRATTVSKTSIYIELPDDGGVPLLFFASEEGTKWARGWDGETVGALCAAHALLDPPVPLPRRRRR
jgi:hypothetical protein